MFYNFKHMKTKLIFCGIIPGYMEDYQVRPEEAQRIVAKILSKVIGKEKIPKILPAVVIYHTDWGCPVGGEGAGAFQLDDCPAAIEVAERLRKRLKQTTLTVPNRTEGKPTIGFTAKAYGELKNIARLWQIKAAELMKERGYYISCGMADNGDGTITISAEANPIFCSSFSQWQEIAEELLKTVNASVIAFEEVYFKYLSDNNEG